MQTISVEVMAIAGNAVTAINKDAHVFYDSELLAVIHRAKVKSSGLVATKVWAWRGRRAQPDELAIQKVQELARRYGTTPVSVSVVYADTGPCGVLMMTVVATFQVAVDQAREPPDFVSVLGGTLATRQGIRVHWSPENTAMHVVRSLRGFIYIDELDLVRPFYSDMQEVTESFSFQGRPKFVFGIQLLHVHFRDLLRLAWTRFLRGRAACSTCIR